MNPKEEGQPVDARGADPVVFEALWTGVVNDWENADRHTRFLDHARASGALHEAARRYAILRSDESRARIAEARVHAVTLIATSELYAARTPKEAARTPTWLYVACLAVVFGLFSVIFSAMFR